MWLCVVLLLTAAAPSVTAARNPGAKIRITQKGLDYAGDIAMQKFAEDARSMKIDDINDKSGHVTYSVWNIRVTGLATPTSRITVDPSGVHAALTVPYLSVEADWRAKFKQGFVKASTSGSISAKAKDVTLNLVITMGATPAGQATMSTVSCASHIGDLSVKFHGGTAWILNLFKGKIADKVRHALEPKICPLMSDVINKKANAALAQTSMEIPVSDSLELDYRLVSGPTFDTRTVDINGRGEGLWAGEASQTALTPGPLSLPTNASERMVYVALSEFPLNTLGEVMFRHGLLTADIDKTVNISGFVVSVSARVVASAAPVAVISPAGLTLTGAARTNAKVDLLGKKLNLNISTTATFEVSAKIASTRLLFAIKSYKTKSSVIPPSPIDIDKIVNDGLMPMVVEELNKRGNSGIGLPVLKFATFVNPNLNFMKGSMVVSTDIKAT